MKCSEIVVEVVVLEKIYQAAKEIVERYKLVAEDGCFCEGEIALIIHKAIYGQLEMNAKRNKTKND